MALSQLPRVRFDSYCLEHARYCLFDQDNCRCERDNALDLKGALFDLRHGYIDIKPDTIAPDFCIRCLLHESEHVNTRCLTQATRFLGEE